MRADSSFSFWFHFNLVLSGLPLGIPHVAALQTVRSGTCRTRPASFPCISLRCPSAASRKVRQTADFHLPRRPHHRVGRWPPLSADGQGVDVIDGHRRTTADQELLAEGLNIEWIRIEPFEGNDLERQARILTSQDNRKLLPLELAEGYRRLKAFGLSNEEIGNLVGKSRQHIEQMLLLAAAPHAVQMMVRSGETAATTAIEAVREHGDGAAAVLGAAKQEAAASGKKKVTTAAIRPWTPPARAVLPMVSAVDAVVQAIPQHVRQAMADKPMEGQMIELPATVIYELLAQQAVIQAMKERSLKKMGN
ncbi:ParB/RepB/Spo0J family partition protein [Herbaspirillum seropedicae]|uniref:ParB/RepB/Spo0J family partition protein n=1 Tax=Herbaspirillum seropedicae TaxID=964 RepID=UPI003F8D545A